MVFVGGGTPMVCGLPANVAGANQTIHNPRMSFPARMRLILLLSLLGVSLAQAGPYLPAGDLSLRSDVQLLADHGIIKGTISTWPLAWGPILKDIADSDASGLSANVIDALGRVRSRGEWDTRTDQLTFRASASAAEEPSRLRSFQNTPRGKAEISAGAGWMGNWLSADLNVQGVDSDQDDEEIRAEDSFVGAVLGNWSIAASTQQRWWGPGWDGSLILSNNARPFPSVVIDRVFTDPFESKWLSWIGPWDLNLTFGQLERDRHVPDAQFFGMRLAFRPIPSLEIGLSRTAQWCGEGRPCDLGTFGNLLVGKDNRGGEGIDPENEPGNQLAGYDFRWSPSFLDHAVAVYGQLIGEDEAGGFPSRYLGQFGAEWSGFLFNRWSARAFVEFAGTSCQFHETSELFNCAYNHTIYRTGYRYRNRVIGHTADNDARLVSVGVVTADMDDIQWRGLLRVGKLNRGGSTDIRNSLTSTPQEVASMDVSHSRVFSFGVIDAGIGYETVDDQASGTTFSDTRVYLQWRSAY